MCAVKFLKLEDFLDDERHGLAIDLEPKGLLFAEVSVYCWMPAVGRLSVQTVFVLIANAIT